MEKLVRMVESKYVGGRPPHWQQAASQTALEGGTSSIFVVAQRDFVKMDPLEIREVHRHRHILVTDVDSRKPVKFDQDGLGMLADLDDNVSIQRMSLSRYF